MKKIEFTAESARHIADMVSNAVDALNESISRACYTGMRSCKISKEQLSTGLIADLLTPKGFTITSSDE
jgi:hypothetical protein